MLKTTSFALGSILLGLGLATTALAQDFALKFQSSDPAGNANYILQQEWTKMVADKTGGKVTVELLPVGSIVAHNETQDAIAAGIIDGHITDTSYFTGKEPAFGLIANPVGAWSSPDEMFDFMENGGGKELMNEILEPYGLHFIGPTTPGLEAFLSKKPLDGVDDLKGLKLRAPEGMVQKVFQAAGAAPVNLPGSEVFTALDKGVIDAADYTVFSTNQEQGMHDVATHPVYPGFHSMPMVEVSINKGTWDAMSPELQATLEQTVKDFAQMQVATLAERDLAAVEAAKAGGEVTVHDWPAEERAKFRAIATGEWEKAASASPASQKVYDTLVAYLESAGLLN
jgi:TRAP-type C4-dicarboxylate transport system substrate-binding protein